MTNTKSTEHQPKPESVVDRDKDRRPGAHPDNELPDADRDDKRRPKPDQELPEAERPTGEQLPAEPTPPAEPKA